MPSSIPESTLSITQISLPLLEEWANETEKQLNPLYSLTKETLATCKQNPQSYKQLLEDLRNAEDIRKKEAAIKVEKAQLQAKYGIRFNELETDWQDIVTVLEWVQKVQAAFLDIPVPQSFAEIAAQGPTVAPTNHRTEPKI